MMAIGIHVVYVRQQQVLNGTVIDKSTASIAEVMRASMEMRIVPDAGIPSSASSPSIVDYLLAEAAAGYKLAHMDNTIIVTYPA
jgi:hypothetical protein